MKSEGFKKLKYYASYFGPKALRVALALGIAVLLHQFLNLSYLEYLTYDLRTRITPSSDPSPFIKTVSLDASTIEKLHGTPGISVHTKFLRQLAKKNPKAIVYKVKLDEIEGTEEERREFVQVAQTLPLTVAIDDLPLKGQEHELLMEPPLDKVPVLPAPFTSDAAVFAKDGVTRRVILGFQGYETLHRKIAKQFNPVPTVNDYQGVFDFYDSQQVYIDFHPSGTYSPISFGDILDGTKLSELDGAQLIIVGVDTFSTSDYIMTPLSRSPTAMTRLEMTANMIDTLIQNKSPIFAPKSLNLVLTAIISLLTVMFIFQMRPVTGLIALFSTIGIYIVAGQLLYMTTDIVVGMAHPLIASFICYYFFVPYRLIKENRKSWEYQQKNRLLTQVEELKSNFLRMMSHDLKTPLARIQGMADIVLKDKSHLSNEQTEALETINQSSEELTEFIGGILNLGRIEGQEIKLHLTSKDINSLLKKVIQKCEYLARKKNIEFIVEFEPMFSIKVDEDLMRQVFTNLVENAIKYSPENSKILISTEEHDGLVVIQVADQGVGINAEEQENIFVKFYRSKDVVNKGVKGSGLGLYLSQYFVNLHSGHIDVESEVGKGSTFSVILPTDGYSKLKEKN